MYILNRDNTIKFIRKVFNYYNGIINRFCKARLIVNWSMRCNSPNGATTSNPNIVTVFPLVMNRFVNNEFQFYYVIFESIIHELYHIDQCIDFIRMTVDHLYKDQIESAVEIQTKIFMASHRKEILENFGLDISSITNDYYRERIKGYDIYNYPYKRKRIIDHWFYVLREVIHNADDLLNLYNNVLEGIVNFNTKLSIEINNNKFIIFDSNDNNQFISDINEFNCFMYFNYFYYTYRNGDYTIDYYINGDINIIVNFIAKQIMCI